MSQPMSMHRPRSVVILSLVTLLGGARLLFADPPGTTGTLDVGGSKLAYEVRGTGPAVVLLHDGLVHSPTWDAQVGPLAQRSRVIRYDRRGYGRSEPARQPYSEVEDLHALL